MWTNRIHAAAIALTLGKASERAVWARVERLQLKRPPTEKRLKSCNTGDLGKGEKKRVKPYVDPEFTGGVLLMDLKPEQCHYPYKGQIYCGEPKETKDYCQKHYDLCYTKLTRTR